jgi:hypothetical protein
MSSVACDACCVRCMVEAEDEREEGSELPRRGAGRSREMNHAHCIARVRARKGKVGVEGRGGVKRNEWCVAAVHMTRTYPPIFALAGRSLRP